MIYPFRESSPQRTCNKTYTNYHLYKDFLQRDFNGRCAYCNISDKAITTPFEIDHFIPEDTFKDVWPELKCTYDNLVYSCKKCNGSKSNCYKGNIKKHIIENELFYDPVKIDYNDIFYRNELGEICSDDIKGRNSITLLCLYRPIHSLVWFCDRFEKTIEQLKSKMELLDKNTQEYQLLKEANYDLMEYERDFKKLLIESYNDNCF